MPKQAKDTLARRLAMGEITEDEFERLNSALDESVGPADPEEEQRPSHNAAAGGAGSNNTAVIVLGSVLGIVVLLGFVLNAARPKLEIVSLGTEGFFNPRVVATLQNTGVGDNYRFQVEDLNGNLLCEGGRTFISEGERRDISISCPKMSGYSGKFYLKWERE